MGNIIKPKFANQIFAETEDLGIYMFACPACNHSHVISTIANEFRHAWEFNNDLIKPTISPSLLITFPNGDKCHSFIKNGIIEFCSDSSHSFAGKSLGLKPYDYTSMEQYWEKR